MQSATVVILFFLLSFPCGAPAALLCPQLFPQRNDAFYQALKFDDFDRQKPEIAKLAVSLAEANLAQINSVAEMRGDDLTVIDLELLENSVGPYRLISAELKNKFGDRINIRIRSNGVAAFLDNTFQYRDARVKKEYKAVYLDRGMIKTIDQGSQFLDSLPELANLSRTLSAAERERWLTDQPFRGLFGQKIHFALNYYRFKDREPFFFEFSRRELLEMYKDGLLEINTYDSFGASAAPAISRSEFGMEFEIVVFSEEGIRRVRPKIKDSLRQDIFQFSY